MNDSSDDIHDDLPDMPEIGNLMFGHPPCGRYRIPRETSYERPVFALLEAAGLDPYGIPMTHTEHGFYGFDNEVFTVRPYYGGDDCSCGIDAAEDAWLGANPHADGCFITIRDRRLAQSGIVDADGILKLDAPDTEHIHHDLVRGLCEKMGLPFVDEWEERCTCGRHDRHDAWLADPRHQHAPDCQLVAPNFLHKQSGFALSWYKYPLRDSWANQALDEHRFAAIMNECRKSIG